MSICNEHSGIKSQNRLLIWLLAIILAVSSSQAAMLLSIKTEIAGFAYRFTSVDQSKIEIKQEIGELKNRVSRLERFDFGHVEQRDGR